MEIGVLAGHLPSALLAQVGTVHQVQMAAQFLAVVPSCDPETPPTSSTTIPLTIDHATIFLDSATNAPLESSSPARLVLTP